MNAEKLDETDPVLFLHNTHDNDIVLFDDAVIILYKYRTVSIQL
jgi:hypothetical protein